MSMQTPFTPEFYGLQNELKVNGEFRNRIGHCQLCGQNIKDRSMTLFKELIDALYDIYCWCGKNKKHEFKRGEVEHLLRGNNNYARFGDLVWFGGLVYKPDHKKAHWGLNMQRCREFFRGQREIPVQVTINQLTNEIVAKKMVKIGDFPRLQDLLDKNGVYDYNMLL